jgi:hypothetical protein
MFDRKDSILKAFQDKSIDTNTLMLMTDFYYNKGKLTLVDYNEIMAILDPEPLPENPV